MFTTNQPNESGLEFEEYPMQADIRISKVVTTPEGARIRVVFTSGNSVMLTSLGDPTGDTVIVTGELPNNHIAYSKLWDTAKAIWSAIKGVFGAGCTTTTTTTVKLGKNGVVESITTTTTTKC